MFCRFLKVQYAFHSAQMDPIRDELLAALDGIRPRPASLAAVLDRHRPPVEGPELGPEYWWQNVRQTVRFADGVDRPDRAGVRHRRRAESTPGAGGRGDRVLRASGQEGRPCCLRCAATRTSGRTMLQSLGGAACARLPGRLEADCCRSHGRFVRLPLYPWQRERCWHEAEESRVSRSTPPAHPLLGVAQGGPRPAWEARLDLRLTPYLADHRVQHAAILPATAYLELAFAAAREAFGADGLRAAGCQARQSLLPRRRRTPLGA